MQTERAPSVGPDRLHPHTTSAPHVPHAPHVPTVETNPSAHAHNTWVFLTDTFKHALVAADAQLSLWKGEVVRVILLAAMSVPLLICFFLLLSYGFVLLDSALDVALRERFDAPWFSPLVRGGVYFGVPAITILVLLKGVIPKSHRK